MSDTNDRKYVTMKLDQPWGTTEEKVRTFPPCAVRAGSPKSSVVVFVKNPGSAWRRKTIGKYDYFPYSGFVAWDDRNNEYAWHQIGTIDVPDAKDPDLGRSKGKVAVAIPAGQTETINPKRKRRSFVEWWSSLGGSDEEFA